MAKEQIAVAELVLNMILGKTGGTRVDYFPQKPDFPFDAVYEQAFARATPESQGISSDLFAALLRELDASKDTEMHHFMALRHGKVICECNFAPYPKGMWHITHSMCKSITGMAIGMLIEEEKLKLDENIYDIFPDHINAFSKIFRPAITVENLLTMTSGVTFNESGIVSGNDWLGSFLNASVNGKPGTEFQYNSLNTYVLSAIVTKRTGETLTEYLTPRLFGPLGITKYYWETCPKGITKGGWGLFLCAEDMAKLGQLYLQRGKWNGQQLVSEYWIEISTARHLKTQNDTYGYGYQLWMEQRPGSFEYNGMLGQNVIIYPDMDMVLVTNAGNKEMFQDCIMLNIIRKYFPVNYHPADVLPENPLSYSLLKRLCGELENGENNNRSTSLRGGWKRNVVSRRKHSDKKYSYRISAAVDCPSDHHSFMRAVSGRTYVMEQQNIGIAPLFVQVFHNNMTDGISEISFTYDAGNFCVSFTEGEVIHKLPVGFGRAADGCVDLHGEHYLVATLGEFARDENDIPVLKLEITFIEECVKRKAHIFFHEDDEIEIRWNETPGKKMILAGLSSITEELSGNFLYNSLLGDHNITTELLHRLMEQTIEPVVRGYLKRPEETDSIDTDE
ncbi:serine hydrolase domain-containing protein [Blautia wexlerae]|uniref:Serine hydrolase n=1 Tax=Blautia wexlerae TaxID=418240 RepID=A0A6L8XUH6_9FIRM|nr:serine hydrolase [Blautia wexlerae]MZS88913.1 serine hydrolase [Blautia wexlerae]MZS92471.1 serine hydrolase [Blautia wexlerae]MZS96739.1 serine hydrolase [Blautia wexlerae]MZT02301.1 serine hydrolase [Blautia wexlerae]MZT03958.1 serine hydrolase [Blautia wexlerae]